MKRKRIISITVFFAFCSFYYLGCNKTDHPLGIYAPNGLDIPTNTPTPTTGNFNIYVVDGTTPISGVTVFLVDPSGNTSTSITQNVVGFAAFNVSNVTNGVWMAGVSQQSFFGFSTMPITVIGNTAGNFYFTAPAQSVSVWNITSPQSYLYNATTNLTYGVSYVQPGNLNEPISLSYTPSGAFPGNWGVTFNPLVLGASSGANAGAVSISVPSCTINQPIFNFIGTKFNNSVSITSRPETITKNFTSNIKVVVTDTASGTGEYYNIKLISSNDCGSNWNIAWSVLWPNGTWTTGNYAASNGNSTNVPTSFPLSLNTAYYVYVTVSGYGNSFSGSCTPMYISSGSVTFVNSNF